MRKLNRWLLFAVLICIGISFAKISSAAEYKYDKINRVIQVTYEDGSYVVYTYDANGNIESVRVFNENQSDNKDDNKSDDNNGDDNSGDDNNGSDGNWNDYNEDGDRGFPQLKNRYSIDILTDLREMIRFKNLSNIRISVLDKLPVNIQNKHKDYQELLEQKENIHKQVGSLTEKRILMILNN